MRHLEFLPCALTNGYLITQVRFAHRNIANIEMVMVFDENHQYLPTAEG